MNLDKSLRSQLNSLFGTKSKPRRFSVKLFEIGHLFCCSLQKTSRFTARMQCDSCVRASGFEKLEQKLALSGDPYPYLQSITAIGPTTVYGNIASYAVVFSEPVTGVDASDFQCSAGNASISVSGSESAYTVRLQVGRSDGTQYPLSLVDDGTIRDIQNHPLTRPGSPVLFSSQNLLPTGKQPNCVTIADLNKDNFPDLLIANYADRNISVYLGNGDGSFRDAGKQGVNGGPFSVTVGDANDDGWPDLIVPNNNDGTVSVLMGTQTGCDFAAQQVYTVGIRPNTAKLGDLNGDGVPDLVVLNEGSNTISVLLGKGDGTFQDQKTVETGAEPDNIQLVDLNGDGMLDIANVNENGVSVSVLLGRGDGSFGSQQMFAAGRGASGLASGDVNNDGVVDLIAANTTSATVSVLLGNGDGTFRPQATFATGSDPWSVAVADLNGDGKGDLLVASNSSDSIGLLLGNGDGTFQNRTWLYTGKGPSWVTTADINNDGRVDVVSSNYDSNSLSVFINQGTGRQAAPKPVSVWFTEPSSPTGLAASAVGAGYVSLAWGSPQFDYGSPVSDYIIQYSSSGTAPWSTVLHSVSTAANISVTGLNNGTGYVFRVAAVNAVGTGSWSSNTSPITPCTVPAVPTSLAGVAGNGQVSLNWSAPSSDGGSPIADYAIQYSTDATIWKWFPHAASTATTATVTGLTSGISYIFRVAAKNGAGTGAYSGPIACLPVGNPSLAITVSRSQVNSGDTVSYTFTLSNPSTTFSLSDIYPTNGAVSNFTAVSSTVYTCTFTPKANFTGTGYVVVYDNTFTDLVGNGNKSPNGYVISFVTIDTVQPTIQIVASKTSLLTGGSMAYTFTLSEASSNFTSQDVYPINGSVSGFTASSSTVYTCTFTPKANFTGTGYVVVYDNTFTDAMGNGNKSPNGYVISFVGIDTNAPTLTIVSNTPNLKAGETATFTFTLSKASTNFIASDVKTLYGTLSNFTTVSSTVYTVKFTPNLRIINTGYVRVNDGVFTDSLRKANKSPNGYVICYVSIDTLHKR